MLRRPHYILIGVVALLALVFFSLPESASSRVKLAMAGLFFPLFGLTEASQNLARRAGNAVVPRADLAREVDQLRTENQQLQFQLAQTGESRRENDRLRQQAGFPRKLPWKVQPARVIARDAANWWRTVFIDVGRRHGVQPDQAVMTAEGLVGRVSAVGETRSQVLLLGDANCRVAALVQETGENGVVIPFPADVSVVTLTYLSRGSPLKPGQTVSSSGLELKPGHAVLSSGLGGVFPKGLRIGEIIDIRNVGYGLYQEARVKLAVNLNALDHVWVVQP